MLNAEEQKNLQRMLKEAFPDVSDEERSERYNNLLADVKDVEADVEAECQIINNHIVRVGVTYKIGEKDRVRYYYSTKYDSDELDD